MRQTPDIEPVPPPADTSTPAADPDRAEEAQEAPAALGCCIDPLSNDGLRALVRSKPKSWCVRLREHLAPETLSLVADGAPVDADIRSVLVAHCPQLLPRAGAVPALAKIVQGRQLSRLLVQHAGDRQAQGVDAKALEELRSELLSTQDPETLQFRSHDRVGRAISLTRDALNRWRASHGRPPVAMMRTNERAGRRDGNYSLPLRAVHDLIRRARPAERGLIALAVSTGVIGSETRTLRRSDFQVTPLHPDGAPMLFMRLEDPKDPLLERWICLPPWVRELFREIPKHGDVVFPRGSAPALAQTLLRLRRPHDEVCIKPTGLRVTYQAIARSMGSSRELVRGRWRQPTGAWPERIHPAALQQWKLCQLWTDFHDGPAGKLLDRSVLVPRRAPAHCAPGASECSPRTKRATPLPPGMRKLPPPPRRLKDTTAELELDRDSQRRIPGSARDMAGHPGRRLHSTAPAPEIPEATSRGSIGPS